MKTLIIGLGKSGLAAAKLLAREGHTLYGVDRIERSVDGMTTFLEDNLPSHLGIDQAILSPGIPQTHPIVQRMKIEGIPLIGEVELAFRYLDQPCIGVTGTNGKTTTTALIAHIFNENGRAAKAVGNIGLPLCDYLIGPNPEETLILELSSFQLETLRSAKLDAALILNITPDHLDRYGTFLDYALAKCHIKNCIKKGGKLFISEETQKKFEKYLGEIDTITFRDEGIASVDLVCRHFGILDSQRAFATFKRPPHRLERVRTVCGIDFINDSKATNVDSVLYALKQMPPGLIMIVGGRDKEGDFSLWRAPFKEKVKGIFGYGEAAQKIRDALGEAIPFKIYQRLEQAVHEAYRLAEDSDTILLSPGCASFDAFANYEERGNVFKQIVNQLTSKKDL